MHPYAATNAYAIPSAADSNPILSAADAHSVADRNTSTYRYALQLLRMAPHAAPNGVQRL